MYGILVLGLLREWYAWAVLLIAGGQLTACYLHFGIVDGVVCVDYIVFGRLPVDSMLSWVGQLLGVVCVGYLARLPVDSMFLGFGIHTTEPGMVWFCVCLSPCGF